MSKSQAVNEWFKKAKRNASGNKPFERTIDPKQAVYAKCSKRRKNNG